MSSSKDHTGGMGKHGWSLSTESVSFIRTIQFMATENALLPCVHSRKALIEAASNRDLRDWSVGDRRRSNASQETVPFPIRGGAISARIQNVIWSSPTFSERMHVLSISRPFPDWVRERLSRLRSVRDWGDIGMENTANCGGSSRDARGIWGAFLRGVHVSLRYFGVRPRLWWTTDWAWSRPGILTMRRVAPHSLCFIGDRRGGSRRNVRLSILSVSNHGLVRASRDIGRGTSAPQSAQ
jgi:hypothetical protein